MSQSHKYPVLEAKELVQHLNAYAGTELADDDELLSTATTLHVFTCVVASLTGIGTDHVLDKEQLSPDLPAPSLRNQQICLLSAALPHLLKAAHVTCPLSIIDISTQLNPSRARKIYDALSGLINLLFYTRNVIQPRLLTAKTKIDSLKAKEKALRSEVANSKSQSERLRAELESSAGQTNNLMRQLEAARARIRSRENELSADQHATEELASRQDALAQEAAGQETMAKSMRARKAKLEEQAVVSPEGLFHLKTKMEEDVQQRKILLESRYKRLDEIKSQGRAAKSQLRLAELHSFFDEADRHRQVLASADESVEKFNVDCGLLEAQHRLLVNEVKDSLSVLESVTNVAGAAASSSTSSAPASGPASQLRDRLAATQTRLTTVMAEERELAAKVDETVSHTAQSRTELRSLIIADRAVSRVLDRLAECFEER